MVPIVREEGLLENMIFSPGVTLILSVITDSLSLVAFEYLDWQSSCTRDQLSSASFIIIFPESDLSSQGQYIVFRSTFWIVYQLKLSIASYLIVD